MSVKLNGMPSRDRSKERIVEPQPTTKTSKVSQPVDVPKIPRPSSGIKPEQRKDNIPPQQPTKTKVLLSRAQIVEANLMTQSRIVEARNGLQLLKKKMSQRGMSRGRIDPQPSQQVREEPLQKRLSQQPAKKPSRQDDSERVDPPSQKVIKKSTSITEQQRPIPKLQPKANNEYYNPNEEIGIQPKNVDFERLIEMEMRKEMMKGSAPSKPQVRNQPKEFDNQQLVECSQGCGRSFNKDAIDKHQKVCKKVFQCKRKVFDSAAARKVEDELAQKEAPIGKRTSKVIEKPASKTFSKPAEEKQKSAIPKWKLESAALRAGLKLAAGKALSKQQQQVSDQQKQQLTLCNFCGRRFNDKAAARHIAFCESKSKQAPSRPLNATTTNLKKKK